MKETSLLLAILDEAYEKKAWQGPNLRGSLRGVTARQAAWRPSPRAHNIWELTLHAAYWKYAVWRMLTGQPRGSFGEKGSNWFARPSSATEGDWRADIARLDAVHRDLRRAAAVVPAARLGRKPSGSKHTAAKLVYAVASHDVYHTGQIQLLKRLWRDRGRRTV